MPDQFQKTPREESIRVFENRTTTHNNVGELKKVKECIYEIRQPSTKILTRVTNIYIIGIADVHELLDEEPNLNCIVTMSVWNSYTSEAKEFCISKGIGLFKFREYYGALNFEGTNFSNFILKEDRKDDKDK